MKPTVVHLITTLDVGGAERALFNLISGGLENYVNNHVVSLKDEGHYGPLLSEMDVPVFSANLPTNPMAFLGAKKLNHLLKQSKPDLIQCWMYHSNLLGLAAKSLSGTTRSIPMVWNVRHTLEDPKTFKPQTRLVINAGAKLSKQAHSIIFNSERALNQHAEIGYQRNTSCVIPNGFDLTLWSPDPQARLRFRQQHNIADSTKVAGFVGRGDKQKDIPTLLQAFENTRKTQPNCALVLIGREHEQYFTNGTPPEGVIALGQRSDVQQLVPALDFLVLSSKSEGFPNVVGEAMACGIPCVSTDVGDAKAIIADTGWIANVSDVPDLSDKLTKAFGTQLQELQRRGQAARHRMQEHFSIEHAVNEYAHLYKTLISEQ